MAWYNDAACWLKRCAELNFPEAQVIEIGLGPPTNGQFIHATLHLNRPEDPLPDLKLEIPVGDCPG